MTPALVLSAAAERLLAAIVHDALPARPAADAAVAAELVRADLAAAGPRGRLVPTQAGRAHVRRNLRPNVRRGQTGRDVDPFRAQHLALARTMQEGPDGPAERLIDEAESPLAWLARRRGRDGRPLIGAAQAQAGERLRAQFTRAQMSPRVTASWNPVATRGPRLAPAGAANMVETAMAARQQVRAALDAVGPEFSGLLLDVCCFLKGLEDVERERGWPPRSAKVVLQLGLARLARHYGLADEARGSEPTAIRAWSAAQAPDVSEA